MKKNQIVVGQLYQAKVSGKVVKVRVDNIREYNPSFGGALYSGRRAPKSQTIYECTNLSTGRTVKFRSVQKFRGPATIDNRPLPSSAVMDDQGTFN